MKNKRKVDFVPNPLLTAFKSDKDMMSYIKNNHVTKIRKDLLDTVKMFTNTLSYREQAEIFSTLINGR